MYLIQLINANGRQWHIHNWHFLHYCQTDIHLEAQLKWVIFIYGRHPPSPPPHSTTTTTTTTPRDRHGAGELVT